MSKNIKITEAFECNTVAECSNIAKKNEIKAKKWKQFALLSSIILGTVLIGSIVILAQPQPPNLGCQSRSISVGVSENFFIIVINETGELRHNYTLNEANVTSLMLSSYFMEKNLYYYASNITNGTDRYNVFTDAYSNGSINTLSQILVDCDGRNRTTELISNLDVVYVIGWFNGHINLNGTDIAISQIELFNVTGDIALNEYLVIQNCCNLVFIIESMEIVNIDYGGTYLTKFFYTVNGISYSKNLSMILSV